MTRILLTGKNGQIGWELRHTLATLGEVTALDRNDMDLSNPDSIRRAVRDCKPHIIVNAAAYTAVDKAEEEPDLAMAINGIAPGILAEEAKRLGAAVIHYSTDYVFDGSKDSPYTEDDVPNALNVYGETKLAGEEAVQATGVPHLIFRTSWVFSSRGKNFIMTIMRLANELESINVVADQYGAPTSAELIAEVTALAILSYRCRTIVSGIYHLTASGETSWYGLACHVVNRALANGAKLKLNAEQIHATPTDRDPRPAKRPKNSRMDTNALSRALGFHFPVWKIHVERTIDQLIHTETCV